jgi:hypothetical protein
LIKHVGGWYASALENLGMAFFQELGIFSDMGAVGINFLAFAWLGSLVAGNITS